MLWRRYCKRLGIIRVPERAAPRLRRWHGGAPPPFCRGTGPMVAAGL